MMFIAGGKAPLPAWMKLTRSRDTFTGAVSSDGRTWTIVGTTKAPLGAVIEFGLVVSSHDTGRLTTSTFDRIVAASQAAQDADIGVVGPGDRPRSTTGSTPFADPARTSGARPTLFTFFIRASTAMTAGSRRVSFRRTRVIRSPKRAS